MSTAGTETKKGIGKAGLLEAATASELKDLGWRHEPLDSGHWAYEINGDRRIGPAATLAALSTQVKLASGPVQAKANGKGNGKNAEITDNDPPSLGLNDADPSYEPRLPTMEEPQIDELNRQADNCIEALKKRKQAVSASKDEDDIMREKMREHGRKRYSRRGWSIVIEESEKLVIKEEAPAAPKNPSTKKGVTVIKGNKDGE